MQIEAGLGKFEIVRYITNCSQKDDDYDEMDPDEIGPNLCWKDLYKDFIYFINLVQSLNIFFTYLSLSNEKMCQNLFRKCMLFEKQWKRKRKQCRKLNLLIV